MDQLIAISLPFALLFIVVIFMVLAENKRDKRGKSSREGDSDALIMQLLIQNRPRRRR